MIDFIFNYFSNGIFIIEVLFSKLTLLSSKSLLINPKESSYDMIKKYYLLFLFTLPNDI